MLIGDREILRDVRTECVKQNSSLKELCPHDRINQKLTRPVLLLRWNIISSEGK